MARVGGDRGGGRMAALLAPRFAGVQKRRSDCGRLGLAVCERGPVTDGGADVERGGDESAAVHLLADSDVFRDQEHRAGVVFYRGVWSGRGRGVLVGGAKILRTAR